MTKPVFQIGLTMAGAISAGAYSAGVFDFLVEALEEWRKAKSASQPGLPRHDVIIKAISGASAGSIVGALGALALADGIEPKNDLPASLQLPSGPQFNPHRCVLPGLYRTWVERPRMTPGNPGELALLTGEDLRAAEGGQKPLLQSALNARLLDAIRDEAIRPRAAVPGPATHPFIADQLHLFLMLGNLHGVPYEISFQSVDAQGNPKRAAHSMLMHGDRAHFRIDGLGTAYVPQSKWANDGTPSVMPIASLFNGQDQPAPAWRHFGQAAVASGAFPVGLRARALHIEGWTYLTRAWPLPIEPGVAIAPSGDWQAGNAAYKFLSVDGGTINNEPFDFARWALLEDPQADERNPRDGARADRAVIMVDPFPEGPDFKFALEESPAIRAIVGRILGMYVNQARFKLEELAAASADTVFSRFLIAPRRSANDASYDGQAAIACGLLEGFGGFLDERFRAHDYQLGRRNCQNFLRHAFAVPLSNQPLGLASGGAAAIDWKHATRGKDGAAMVPIIPLVGSAAREVPAPRWQKMTMADLFALRPHVKNRANAVAVQALKETIACTPIRWLLHLLWCVYGRYWLVNKIMAAVRADLKKRDQLWSVWERAS